jgi:spore coat polysaccharide biosynthesis predicted glycosyltransferase SpsG
MRFVIRADASAKIGAGHVMRCCAIAEELIDTGQKVVFVGETKSLPWVQERVSALGFSDIYADPEHFHSDPKSDVLILDSYGVDPGDSFISASNWRGIVAIVDDATPQVYADLYIHPGSGTTWLPPLSEKEVQFLSGIEYIPIRKSIQSSSLRHHSSSEAELNILVIGGGSDFLDFCGAIGSALHILSEQFSAIFFVGHSTTLPPDTRFTSVAVGAKIEDFLDEADLVFTTAGTSSWELLSCGLPLGLACAVDNQVANYQYQTQAHLALGVGLHNDKGKWELDRKAIHKLVAYSEIREELSKKASHVVDGKGCARIAHEILLLDANLFRN